MARVHKGLQAAQKLILARLFRGPVPVRGGQRVPVAAKVQPRAVVDAAGVGGAVFDGPRADAPVSIGT